jgi:hypothetical protein
MITWRDTTDYNYTDRLTHGTQDREAMLWRHCTVMLLHCQVSCGKGVNMSVQNVASTLSKSCHWHDMFNTTARQSVQKLTALPPSYSPLHAQYWANKRNGHLRSADILCSITGCFLTSVSPQESGSRWRILHWTSDSLAVPFLGRVDNLTCVEAFAISAASSVCLPLPPQPPRLTTCLVDLGHLCCMRWAPLPPQLPAYSSSNASDLPDLVISPLWLPACFSRLHCLLAFSVSSAHLPWPLPPPRIQGCLGRLPTPATSTATSTCLPWSP